MLFASRFATSLFASFKSNVPFSNINVAVVAVIVPAAVCETLPVVFKVILPDVLIAPVILIASAPPPPLRVKVSDEALEIVMVSTPVPEFNVRFSN